MERRGLFIAGLRAVAFFGSNQLAFAKPAQGPVLITVDPRPRQIFKAFGLSHARADNKILAKLPDLIIENALNTLYSELPVDILHVWLNATYEWPADRMLSEFRTAYLERDVLKRTMLRNMPQILLGPSQNHRALTISPQEYAESICEVIKRLKSEDKITISSTGISNEPGKDFSDDAMISCILRLRSELDKAGLKDVNIVAPESASVNSRALQMISAIKSTPAAWDALGGIATHSYNMATNDGLAALTEDKALWITEAGVMLEQGSEAGDTTLQKMEAATVAGRFLADINHGATHWLWFVGLTAHAVPNWKYAGLAEFDQNGQLTLYPRFYYLRHLLKVFTKGSVIRRCISIESGTMAWGYGPKPRITAAYATNNEGKVRVGIVNSTSIVSTTNGRYAPSQEIECTFSLPIANRTMLVIATTSDCRTEPRGTIRISENGSFKIKILPLELVTLEEI